MRRFYQFVAAIGLLFVSYSAQASHILGGEIRMETTSETNRFSFSMILFWDQNRLTVANREPSVEILFYRKRDNQLVFRTSLPYITSRNVDYQNQVCSGVRNLKTVEGTYNAKVSLNPGDFSDSGGYYIVWERCCRNADISNIREPGASGLVFYLEFPPLSVRNSSPVFNFPNGDYICLGLPYSTNLSATDADGDELRYSVVTPFRGNTSLDYPIGDDSPKSGYPLIEWLPGISAQNMIPGNPALSIDLRTGRLTVTASQLGLYVFTVQCEEYRNGVKIGVVRRDFQSLVIECSPDLPPVPAILYNQQPSTTVELCNQKTVQLQVQEPGNWAYQWKIDGQDIPGATASTLQVSQVGHYTVLRSSKGVNQDQCSMPVSSEPVEIVPGPRPSALINKNKSILCEGGTLTLQAETKSSYAYEWRKGMNRLAETGSVLTVNEGGTYSLLVRNEQNGCTATDSIEVKAESIRVTLPAEVEVLKGQSVLLTPKVESTSSDIKYEWSPSDGLSRVTEGNPLASPEKTTDYILQVKTSGGCQATAPIRVVVNECKESPIPFPVILYKNQPVQVIELCAGKTMELETDGGGDWKNQWQINGQDIIGATGSSYMASKLGKYTVIRSIKNPDPAVCTNPARSKEVEVIAGIPPSASIEATSTVLCIGKSLQLSADTNAASTQYKWSLEGKMLNQTGNKVNIDSPGTYTLVVIDEKNGCTSTDSILIVQEKISVLLAEEIWVKRGEPVTLHSQVKTSNFPVTYLWSPSIGLSNPFDSLPVAFPDQSTKYVVRVSTPGGCEATDSIRVSIIDRIFLPDAFSPNGDGINDVFLIPNGESLIENIKIYNRWGQVIFSETGYTVPWDGYFKNAVVENGMYNYIIKTSTNVYKGAVHVIY